MKNKHYLITIVGPTAVGKSALALQLAQYYRTEIISADSRQFYKEMHIGTAVPSREELAKVPHHFIQHRSIFEPYSVGDFERDAVKKSAMLFKKHHIAIMAGGSGLYIDALLNGLDDFPEVDPEIRTALSTTLQEEGIEALQSQLRKVDPDYFSQVDVHNPQRLIRALSIYNTTKKPYSSFLKKKHTRRNFIPIILGLTTAREMLYERINQRVAQMMEQGLLTEAAQLYPHRALNALQTVGYKELFDHFDGKYTLKTAVSEIKKNTRRYAKRQLTWFRRNNTILWFDTSTDTHSIIRKIHQRI
ncbi:MAG: tRNA (adenosine(37)-N6)-dimethylallyltransferase MiaA [Bacteroidota bacterium]